MYLCYFSKWTYFTCFSRQKIPVFLNIVEIKMNWNFHENGSLISPSHLMRKNILEYVYKLISIKILTSFTCLEKSQASRDLYLKRIVIRDHKIFWAIQGWFLWKLSSLSHMQRFRKFLSEWDWHYTAIVNKVETWLDMFVSVSTIVLYDGWPSENHVTVMI